MPPKPLRLDLLLALAAHWRSQGEYWCGTPEDSRSQSCADDLLQVLGLDKDAHTAAGSEYGELLKAHGVRAHVEPKDRGDSSGAHLGFLEGEARRLAEEAAVLIREDLRAGTERATKDGYQESIIHEKLGWAFEHGYCAGFDDGAKARKMRYKRPVSKPSKPSKR
jgi:hypothetical protein